MNSIVWTTFVLVVLVAPTLAIGAGTALGALGTSRRHRPIVLAGELAIPVPLMIPAPTDESVQMVAARPQISVEPRPGGRWAVRKDGSQRASRVFDAKDDAIARANVMAERHHADVVVLTDAA